MKIPFRLSTQNFLFFIFPFGFLTGPFLSDFILSLFGIYFLYLTVKLNLWENYNKLFFKFSLAFFILIIISGVLSKYPYLSLIDFGGPIFYFRNFIFIIFVMYAMNKIKDFIKIIYFAFFLTITFVLIDGFIQFTFGVNLFGMRSADYDLNRLTGIFGKEQILGHFLSYVYPIFCTLHFIIFKKISKFQILFIALFSFLVLFLALISGDRTGFLKLIIFISFAGLFVKEYRKFFLIFSFLGVILFTLLVNFNERSSIRFDNTINDIAQNKTFLPIGPGHEDLFLSGYNMFLDFPVIGAGPQMYRVLCNEVEKYAVNDHCSTHVHNYYFQTIGELGLIGLFFLLLFYLFLCKSFLYNIIYSKQNYPLLFINLGLLLSFLPIIAHFNFYNNWANPMLALSLGIFLYLNEKKFNEK